MKFSKINHHSISYQSTAKVVNFLISFPTDSRPLPHPLPDGKRPAAHSDTKIFTPFTKIAI